MATDAEASLKRKSKSKKKMSKGTTLSPCSPPPRSPSVVVEELPPQQNPLKPSSSPGNARESVTAARRLVIDEEDGREDRGDDKSAPKSTEPVSVVPAKGGIPGFELATTTEAVVAATPAMTSAKKPGRKWGEAEQLTLLKEMVGYADRNGPCRMSKPYITGFQSSLPEGSSTNRFSVNEILDKMKRLKRSHANPNGMGKGNLKGSKPLTLEMVELSMKLWAEAGIATAQKKTKAVVKVEVLEDDNDEVDKDEDDDGRRNSGHAALLWEEAVVDFVGKKFTWSEKYTRRRIASVDKSARDSMVMKWMKAKDEVDIAVLNLTRVEDDHLEALCYF